MDKERILTDFDHLRKAKKQSATALKLCLIFAVVVVLLVLFWGFAVSQTALSKVVILSKSGEYLQTEAVSTEALFSARIQSTCNFATTYANSFDRQSIKMNQARAQFYVNRNDLNAIFQKYFNDRAYSDATNAGAVYNCNLEKIEHIEGDNEPYKVSFTSLLNVYSGGKVWRFRLHCDGEIISTTPRYPENVTGFMFSRLVQRTEQLPTEQESQSNGPGEEDQDYIG